MGRHESSVTGPSVTGPSVTGPSVTEPSVTEPSVTGPSVTGASVTEPGGPAGEAAAAISIDELTVVRSKNHVLKSLSATIQRSRVTGLLGPSGAGKTTLIRAIVAAQQITAGRVTVLGMPVATPALRRRIGYVTQAPSVYLDLSVEENVRYFASVVGAPRSASAKLIDQFQLRPIARQLVRDTSGGQRARTSLVCALVGEPELLLLDEPTVGQDPVLREQLWEAFRALAVAGTTVVVSSHVMEEASRCDDLLLLRDGELLAQGSPGAIEAQAGADNMDDAFLTLIRRADAEGRDEAPSLQAAVAREGAAAGGEGPGEGAAAGGEGPGEGADEPADRPEAKSEGAQQR